MSMSAIKIALVGLGKIARDQHVPALLQSDSFELIATASPSDRLEGVRNYPHLEALLSDLPEVEAVAICTPPQVRFGLARRALEQGCHVLLEKPPTVSLSEGHVLIDLARQRGLALFAAWHSREAAGVEPARAWLMPRRLDRVRVRWKEDVRVWHPGQGWIWQAGGLGVFDPGINALSILTRILPGTLWMREAELAFPSNCATPIAARLKLATTSETDITMELDFLHTGSPPVWDIDVDTDGGPLQLSRGGSQLSIGNSSVVSAGDLEYRGLYVRFAQLVSERRIDVDLAPLTLVADAFLSGQQIRVAPFVE
jgi:D-galactose 1-dehydrogenase